MGKQEKSLDPKQSDDTKNNQNIEKPAIDKSIHKDLPKKNLFSNKLILGLITSSFLTAIIASVIFLLLPKPTEPLESSTRQLT